MTVYSCQLGVILMKSCWVCWRICDPVSHFLPPSPWEPRCCPWHIKQRLGIQCMRAKSISLLAVEWHSDPEHSEYEGCRQQMMIWCLFHVMVEFLCSYLNFSMNKESSIHRLCQQSLGERSTTCPCQESITTAKNKNRSTMDEHPKPVGAQGPASYMC